VSTGSGRTVTRMSDPAWLLRAKKRFPGVEKE
jgi:hypothetical protein